MRYTGSDTAISICSNLTQHKMLNALGSYTENCKISDAA